MIIFSIKQKNDGCSENIRNNGIAVLYIYSHEAAMDNADNYT
ncbi:MAG TPA: hypothetical protein VFJ05_03130 [Nitrososphaeraceae archaeon]|nr:hypothetical protein [Nitrososphaeraceae archaeon]